MTQKRMAVRNYHQLLHEAEAIKWDLDCLIGKFNRLEWERKGIISPGKREVEDWKESEQSWSTPEPNLQVNE